MRTYTTLLSFLFLTIFLACNPKEVASKKESRVFRADSLRGRYKLSLSLNKDSLKDESKQMKSGLFGLILYGSNVQMEFLDNNKGLMTMEGGVLGFLAAMSNSGNINKFSYNLIDSTLVIKQENSNKQDTLGTVVKYTNDYSILDIRSPELIQISLTRVDR